MTETHYAQKTGKAYFKGEAVDITVCVQDTQRGRTPVVVEWPLFRCRFASLVDVRTAFMPFAQFTDVPQEVKDLVDACLDELGVPRVPPY